MVQSTGRNGCWRDRDAPAKFRPGFLERLDQRTETAKGLRARFEAIVADLGGPSELSAVKASLLERFLFAELWLARLEVEIVKAPDAASACEVAARWSYTLNAFVRLAVVLGLERKVKRLDLQTYLGNAVTGHPQLPEAAPAADPGLGKPEASAGDT